MNEKESAQRLTKLLFILKKEMTPKSNRRGRMGPMDPHSHTHDHMGHRDMMMLNGICEMGKEDMVKMSAISEFFHITPAAVSQCIRDFENEGWVERVVLDNDRRSVYVKVTDDAKKMMKHCQDEVWQQLLAFIEYLGEDDSETLLRIMEKATLYMKNKREEESK